MRALCHLLFALTAATPGLAQSVGTMMDEVPPPPAVTIDVTTGALKWFFTERRAWTLTSPVDVDILTPTTVHAPMNGVTPGTIPAGTNVHVFLVHARLTVPFSVNSLVQFPYDVLGVIHSDALLDASDVLGSPTTTYPTGQYGRGTAEHGSTPSCDRVILSADRRSLDLQTCAWDDQDQVRILMAAPCPATAASETIRLGEPPNPLAFLPGRVNGPILGAYWDPWFDHTTFAPESDYDFVGVDLEHGPLNVSTTLGTLLIVPPPRQSQLYGVPRMGGFRIPIPDDCSLAGTPAWAQGMSYTRSGIFELANGLDLVLGTH